MKEILDRIGITDLFAYLLPGVLVLSSTLLWTRPEPELFIGSDLASQPLIVGAFIVIAAYLSGMVIYWASTWLLNYYRLKQIAIFEGSSRLNPNRIYRRVVIVLFWLLIPVFRSSTDEQERTVKLYFKISKALPADETELMTMGNPWDMYALIRSLATHRLGSRANDLIEEAKMTHARMLFAYGTALAFWLIALQVTLRIIIWVLIWGLQIEATGPDLPYHGGSAFIAVALSAGLTSLIFKGLGDRCWYQETLLTLRIAEIANETTNPQASAADPPLGPIL